jgi:hypothetical protein
MAENFKDGGRKTMVQLKEMEKRCTFPVLTVWFIELRLLSGIIKLNIKVFH